VYSVSFSPDGKRLVSAGEDRMVKVWDATTGQALLTLRGHAQRVTCVCFSPDGKRLASASWDKTIRLWDAALGQEMTFHGPGPVLSACCFSPDGQSLACGGDADVSGVTQWDMRTGQEVRGI